MPRSRDAAHAESQFANARSLLRLPIVIQATGLGRSTIYKLVSLKKFPAPVRLTTRAVAWRRADIERWTTERPPATHWFQTGPTSVSRACVSATQLPLSIDGLNNDQRCRSCLLLVVYYVRSLACGRSQQHISAKWAALHNCTMEGLR